MSRDKIHLRTDTLRGTAIVAAGTVLIVLVLGAFFYSRLSFRPTHSIDVNLLAALEENTFPLLTVAPEEPFQDLEFLRTIMNGKRIVALGEATHGTREFFLMKHRLIEFLVYEMGFNLFAIEAGEPACSVINRYVLEGKGDPLEAVLGFEYWTWRTEEVLDLVKWMRAYNSSSEVPCKLKFFGIDPIHGDRDNAMAHKVEEILEREGKDSKILVWAHNGHISKQDDPFMGYKLYQRFSDQVYLLGFEFNEGEFTSRNVFGLKSHRVGPVTSQYYAFPLSNLSTPLRFLDFKTMQTDDDLSEWLDAEWRSHSVDEMFYITQYSESWYTTTCPWSKSFDGVVFVKNSTKSRHLTNSFQH